MQYTSIEDLLRQIVREELDRALGSKSDEWLPLDRAATYAGLDEEHGPRVISDDARRGRIKLGHAGRTPVVRKSELDRWIASRGVQRRAPKPAESTTADALSAVERAAKRWAS